MLAPLMSAVLSQIRPATLNPTILHTNDVHGPMFSFAYVEVAKGSPEMATPRLSGTDLDQR